MSGPQPQRHKKLLYFIRANHRAPETWKTYCCQQCGVPIARSNNARPPRFCGIACQLFAMAPPRGATECWDWTGVVNQRGYGRFYHPKTKLNFLAHRAAWMLANGREIPEGMVICHACDRPICCNPAHLFLGTHSDNVQDAMRKERRVPRRGEQHCHAKLTADDVRFIRDNRGLLSHSELASKFGVVNSVISNILRGAAWRHLA